MSTDALIAHRRRMGMIPSKKMPETRADDDCGCGGSPVVKANGKATASTRTARTAARPVAPRRMVRCSQCDRLISARTSDVEGYVCPLCERSFANG